MDREIEFRGKRIDNEEWAYGHLFYGKNQEGQTEAFIVSKNYNCYGGIIDLDTCASWKVDINTIGQYVGTGEYGKIYEGMKLYDEYADENCTIEYDEKDCTFRLYYEGYTELIETLDGLRILEED